MRNIIKYLNENKLTISTCESLTAGLFASYITSISGASSVFKGGLVTYQNEIKKKLLKLDEEFIIKYGVISEEMAIEMSKRTNEILNTDICISFTGNSGPTAMENKEVGLVYCSISIKDKIYVNKYNFEGNREEIRTKCCEEGIKFLRNSLGL